MTNSRFRPNQGWFSTWLSRAYLLNGEVERARNLALEALEITKDVQFWHAVGWAQRAVGQAALASGDFVESEKYLAEARHTFSSIQSRFELGRTYLDLARLACSRGNREVAFAHLKEGMALFKAVDVPRYVELTRQLGVECEISALE